jgi:hypothetical protein
LTALTGAGWPAVLPAHALMAQRERYAVPLVKGHGVAVNKFAPFAGLSLRAAEVPWLIKDLDRDERGSRDRCPTISTTISGDWPEEVPITEAEIEVLEAWFGDLFDELFSARH